MIEWTSKHAEFAELRSHELAVLLMADGRASDARFLVVDAHESAESEGLWRADLAAPRDTGDPIFDADRVEREVALVYAIATADNATRAMIAEERGAHERRIAKLADASSRRVSQLPLGGA